MVACWIGINWVASNTGSVCVSGQPWGRTVNWRRKVPIAIAVVVVSAAGLFAPGFDAAAAQTVGMVTKVQNQAQVGGQAAAVGSPVHLNDTLQTGANARLQVTFRDNTNLTLGENATVVIDRFVFDPDAGVGEATLNATKGALRMVTGRLTEMPNKNVQVKTSFGALAVRGTDFWSGSVGGKTGVLLVHNSRLEVKGDDCPEDGDNRKRSDKDRERCRCAVTLDQAEEGTYIDRRTGCPLLPRQWTPAEINSALSTTSFSLALGPSTIPAAIGLAAAVAAFIVSTNQDDNPPPKVDEDKPASP